MSCRCFCSLKGIIIKLYFKILYLLSQQIKNKGMEQIVMILRDYNGAGQLEMSLF